MPHHHPHELCVAQQVQVLEAKYIILSAHISPAVRGGEATVGPSGLDRVRSLVREPTFPGTHETTVPIPAFAPRHCGQGIAKALPHLPHMPISKSSNFTTLASANIPRARWSLLSTAVPCTLLASAKVASVGSKPARCI